MIIEKDFNGKPGFEVVQETEGGNGILILFKGKMCFRLHLTQDSFLNTIGLHVYGHDESPSKEAHLYILRPNLTFEEEKIFCSKCR